MFVAVYFNGETEAGRDELGDLVLDALMDQGQDRAKITGGGSGLGGFNIDLEVDDALGIDEILRRVREVLQSSEDIPRDTDIQIEEKTFPLHPKKVNGDEVGT